MKKIIIFSVMSLLFLFPLFAEAADTYEIDPVHSTMVFKIKHLNTAYFYGRFNEVKGSITADKDNPAKSRVSAAVKAESLDTDNEKRDKHLKSPDFFNVKQFPEIKFESNTVKHTGGDTYMVSGKLSLHGVEKPLQVEFTKTGEGKDPWGSYRMGFHTSFKIKRSDFGMKFMLDGISDEVELFIGIEAIRKES